MGGAVALCNPTHDDDGAVVMNGAPGLGGEESVGIGTLGGYELRPIEMRLRAHGF
jgi:hypothetical protein